MDPDETVGRKLLLEALQTQQRDDRMGFALDVDLHVILQPFDIEDSFERNLLQAILRLDEEALPEIVAEPSGRSGPLCGSLTGSPVHPLVRLLVRQATPPLLRLLRLLRPVPRFRRFATRCRRIPFLPPPERPDAPAGLSAPECRDCSARRFRSNHASALFGRRQEVVIADRLEQIIHRLDPEPLDGHTAERPS